MSTVDLAQKALGQLFIIGFRGLELSDDTAAFLSQAGIGGVILFSNNYESPGQVAELINQVQENRTDLPFWIGVDHEGGRVQRFKKPFTRIPEAAAIGAKNSPKLAFDIAAVMAKELKAIGVNVNFCPVVDIATNPKNPVIGNRSYGSTEDVVSKISSAIMRGHVTHGVQPCVKHFPGHGDTTVDSHLGLPKIDIPLEVLMEREFRPFTKAFRSHCAMVMTAHILNPKIDPEKPATLSSITLREILRKQLRYSRVIISDDMEMKAIADNFSSEDAPKMAVEAGCDILIYRTEEAARHAYEVLLNRLETGKLSPEIVLEAAQRVTQLKREVLPGLYKPVAIAELAQKIGTPEHEAVIMKLTTDG